MVLIRKPSGISHSKKHARGTLVGGTEVVCHCCVPFGASGQWPRVWRGQLAAIAVHGEPVHYGAVSQKSGVTRAGGSRGAFICATVLVMLAAGLEGLGTSVPLCKNTMPSTPKRPANATPGMALLPSWVTGSTAQTAAGGTSPDVPA